MTRNEYYGNLMLYKKNHKDSLEHSSSLLNRFMENTKYYKRIGQPGKYRYFYSKEEYDAYANNEAKKSGAAADAARQAQNRNVYETQKATKVAAGKGSNSDNGTAKDQARREAEKRQAYEDEQRRIREEQKRIEEGYEQRKAKEEYEKDLKENEKKEQEYNNNYDGATVRKYSEISRNSSPDAAAKAYVQDSEDYKAYKKAIEDGIANGTIVVAKVGDDYRVQPSSTNSEEDYAYFNNVIAPIFSGIYKTALDIDKTDGKNNSAFYNSWVEYNDSFLKGFYKDQNSKKNEVQNSHSGETSGAKNSSGISSNMKERIDAQRKKNQSRK